MDESHVSVPQIGGMAAGDRHRKTVLVEHGFRLPSALDNRPLNFEEFQSLQKQTIYVSATPAPRELEWAKESARARRRAGDLQSPSEGHSTTNTKPAIHALDGDYKSPAPALRLRPALTVERAVEKLGEGGALTPLPDGTFARSLVVADTLNGGQVLLAKLDDSHDQIGRASCRERV